MLLNKFPRINIIDPYPIIMSLEDELSSIIGHGMVREFSGVGDAHKQANYYDIKAEQNRLNSRPQSTNNNSNNTHTINTNKHTK